MDVRLSPEQQALRDSAAQLVSTLGPGSVGELADAERAAKLEAAVASVGWRELRTAVGDGDSRPLASAVDAALVAEELGRGLADTAYLGPTLAAELRRLAGAPAAATPETVLLVPDLAGLAHASNAHASGVAIDARGCGYALMLTEAATDTRQDGNGAGLVAAAYRLARVALPEAAAVVDLTRALAVVTDAAAEPVDSQRRSLSDADVIRWSALALALTCADLVGVMSGAVGAASAYAKVRHQYGAPIGSFQAVQHLLADAFVATEGSRSLALHAAWAADALPPEPAMTAAAVAKAYCSRAARAACEAAIQVHGGIGNTWECIAHVFLRRALLSSRLMGGETASLARVLADHGLADVGTTERSTGGHEPDG